MTNRVLFALFALLVGFGASVVLLYEPAPRAGDVVDVGEATRGEATGPRHCLARAFGHPCPDEPEPNVSPATGDNPP